MLGVETGTECLFQTVEAPLSGDHQKPSTEPGHMPVQAIEFFVALDVAAGCSKHLSHGHHHPGLVVEAFFIALRTFARDSSLG
ncbi:hypothetical protein D3C86_1614200 [compost metagenome]